MTTDTCHKGQGEGAFFFLARDQVVQDLLSPSIPPGPCLKGHPTPTLDLANSHHCNLPVYAFDLVFSKGMNRGPVLGEINR
jgi:hypothetical protein